MVVVGWRGLPNDAAINQCSMWIRYPCCFSVAQLCPTLCDPMDCSTLGFPVLHCLLEFAQTYVHWFNGAIQPSHCLQSFPASGSFPMSWLFVSGGQNVEASASVSALPMNIQGLYFRIDCFDLFAVQGTLMSLLHHHTSKASILRHLAFFII